MKPQTETSMDRLDARSFDRDEFSRRLHISTRTFDRRRIRGTVPPPDERDETGHPLWLDSTVREVLSRRRTA